MGNARSHRIVREAAVQAAPALLDTKKSLARAVDLTAQAGAGGARGVGLRESWLPGYPAWLDLCPGAAYWDHGPAKTVHARLRENSLLIPGEETARLGQAARDAGVVLVIGVHERLETGPGHGTLYNTQLVFG